MDDRSRKTLWMLAGAGAAAGAAIATRKAIGAGWRAATGEDAPRNPVASDVDWPAALLWGAVVGAAAGLARVAARRGAALAWHRATGDKPPPIPTRLGCARPRTLSKVRNAIASTFWALAALWSWAAE